MRHYIGGIAAMDVGTFQAVDGFPNSMEGWGGEDDALRDRLHGGVHAVRSGWVTNLETDVPETAGACRAKDNPAAKLPKPERHAIRARWRARHPTETGLRGLVFMGRHVERARPVPDGPVVHMVELDISLPPLPPGWAMMMSASRGLPYFVHRGRGWTQWTFPTGEPASIPGKVGTEGVVHATVHEAGAAAAAVLHHPDAAPLYHVAGSGTRPAPGVGNSGDA